MNEFIESIVCSLLCVKCNVRFFLPGKVNGCKQAGRLGEHHLRRHGDIGQDKDIFHLVILRLQQLAKVLLTVIQHDDLIAGVFLQKKIWDG